jgi:hypothetical protein
LTIEADALVVKVAELTTDEDKKFYDAGSLTFDADDLVVKAAKLTTDAAEKFYDAPALMFDADDLVVKVAELTTDAAKKFYDADDLTTVTSTSASFPSLSRFPFWFFIARVVKLPLYTSRHPVCNCIKS